MEYTPEVERALLAELGWRESGADSLGNDIYAYKHPFAEEAICVINHHKAEAAKAREELKACMQVRDDQQAVMDTQKELLDTKDVRIGELDTWMRDHASNEAELRTMLGERDEQIEGLKAEVVRLTEGWSNSSGQLLNAEGRIHVMSVSLSAASDAIEMAFDAQTAQDAPHATPSPPSDPAGACTPERPATAQDGGEGGQETASAWDVADEIAKSLPHGDMGADVGVIQDILHKHGFQRVSAITTTLESAIDEIEFTRKNLNLAGDEISELKAEIDRLGVKLEQGYTDGQETEHTVYQFNLVGEKPLEEDINDLLRGAAERGEIEFTVGHPKYEVDALKEQIATLSASLAMCDKPAIQARGDDESECFGRHCGQRSRYEIVGLREIIEETTVPTPDPAFITVRRAGDVPKLSLSELIEAMNKNLAAMAYLLTDNPVQP